eukprot:7458705-Lingulodinium_polyedra.AAC.1
MKLFEDLPAEPHHVHARRHDGCACVCVFVRRIVVCDAVVLCVRNVSRAPGAGGMRMQEY